MPVVAAAVAFGVVYTFLVSTTGWMMLVLGISVYCVVYGALMWLFGMNHYEKDLVMGCLRVVTRRRQSQTAS
jgi:ABC-type spermidine/putrescine transport system permease subunit II